MPALAVVTLLAVVGGGLALVTSRKTSMHKLPIATKFVKSPPALGGGGGSYQPVALPQVGSFLGGILSAVTGGSSAAAPAVSAGGTTVYGGNPSPAPSGGTGWFSSGSVYYSPTSPSGPSSGSYTSGMAGAVLPGGTGGGGGGGAKAL